MSTLEDFIARIEETCGEEKSAIVTFKYNKKNEVIKKILERAQLKKSLAGIIYELSFQGKLFRLFSSGKVIFKDVKEKENLSRILADLIL
jgi:TATA-box binding protein (TBP) (component of TFIID and TFIIIB)